jgi:zinc D-Ala-D-Ala carboxypeptidase
MANDPTEIEIENMRVLCEKVLQPVRNYYGMGVKVNSVALDIRLVNAKVGGSATSDHCKGFAADIEIPGVANADLAQWIAGELRVPAAHFGVLHGRCTLIRAGCM